MNVWVLSIQKKYSAILTAAAVWLFKKINLLGKQKISIQNSKQLIPLNSRGFPYSYMQRNSTRYSSVFICSLSVALLSQSTSLSWHIFQRYCSTDFKTFAVSFTFTAQNLTNKMPKQNLLLDCQVVCLGGYFLIAELQ